MFLDEIAAKLVAAHVGVIGTNIFLSSSAKIPAGDGPYLTLIETGGSAPGGYKERLGRVHNKAAAETQSPTAQIAVRAKSYVVARTMAKAAYFALDGTWNQTLSGVFYLSITARQEPTDIGLDDAGRVMIVFNIDAEKEPS